MYTCSNFTGMTNWLKPYRFIFYFLYDYIKWNEATVSKCALNFYVFWGDWEEGGLGKEGDLGKFVMKTYICYVMLCHLIYIVTLPTFFLRVQIENVTEQGSHVTVFLHIYINTYTYIYVYIHILIYFIHKI